MEVAADDGKESKEEGNVNNLSNLKSRANGLIEFAGWRMVVKGNHFHPHTQWKLILLLIADNSRTSDQGGEGMGWKMS